MKAIYTNTTDYGQGRKVVMKVRVVGYVVDTIEDHSRRYGSHDKQTVAICVNDEGQFFQARLHQLRVVQFRVPWWKLVNHWNGFKAWCRRNTPNARARRRGRRFIYDGFSEDEDGFTIYPTREEVELRIESIRHVNSAAFVEGAESVLDDYHFRKRS